MDDSNDILRSSKISGATLGSSPKANDSKSTSFLKEYR